MARIYTAPKTLVILELQERFRSVATLLALIWLAYVGSVMAPAHCAAQCELPPAVILTMVQVHSLHPDPEYLAMFESHLAQIQAAYPFFGTMCPWLPWNPGEIIIVFTEEALALWEVGEFTGWDELNEKYDVTIGPLRSDWLKLHFDPLLHTWAVSEEYQEVDGVKYAFPNARGILDCHPTTVEYTPPASYYYFLADGERCPAGRWLVEVTPDGDVLVTGSPIPVAADVQSWSTLKSTYR